MGQTHAHSWTQLGVEIGGIVSAEYDNASAFATQYGSQAFTSLAAMLAHIDIVDICTPTHLHHAMVLEAAAAKKHIICEKPLARTVAEAEEMISFCHAQGVKLLVAQVVRYFPEYAAAHAQVTKGVIGEPAIIRLSRGGFRPKPAWFHDQTQSGGLMLDMMIHDFDFARWIAGDVVRVFAKKISSSHPNAPVDHALAILTHQSGAISHVEGSWAYPPTLFRTRCEIAGSDGLIEHDSEKARAIISYRHNDISAENAVPLPSNPLLEDPYTTQLRAFYAHIVDDAPLLVTAEDGKKALAIALAALNSAESGQVVTL